ncbi:MAG: hypothetical protein QM756_34340 [Polyangiaceae bacterium]
MPAPDPTVHRHDGFYLRLGLGGGFFAGRIAYTWVENGERTSSITSHGGGVAFEFAMGGTVAPGLVIGGGIYSSSAQHANWNIPSSLSDKLATGTIEGGQGSIGLLGVIVDYYPNPQQGFHVQGGLGIGTLTFEADKLFPLAKWAGGGGGAMVGVGYEFWVSSQWSIGGIARVLGVSGTVRPENTSQNFSSKFYAPALLLVATHH